MKLINFIFFFSLITQGVAYANCEDNRFWNSKQGKGWFWKEECLEEEVKADNKSAEPQYTILPDKQKIPWEILDKIDPDEVAKVIEPSARKIAITYPTKENITEYRKLALWITNKAVGFTDSDRQIRTDNPNELMAGLMNSGVQGQQDARVVYAVAEQARKKTLIKYADNAGLIVFVSPTCNYCKQQLPVLDMLKEEYGWEYILNDISKNNEMVVNLGIESTPDIFIALNKNGNIQYQRIATGYHAYPKLISSILYGLKYLGENLDENVFKE